MATKANVKADVRQLVSPMAGYKGCFTCEERTLRKQWDALLEPGHPASEDSLALARSCLDKLTIHSNNMDGVIMELCCLTPEDSKQHLALGSNFVAQLSNIKLKFTRVMDQAKERKQAQLVATAAAANAAAACVAPFKGAYVRPLVLNPSVSPTTSGMAMAL
jgi:hypothetical protein